MSKELNVAIEAARKAGELQLARLHSKHTLKKKGTKDFATEVDLESERIILGTIKENFPEHSFLSEESGLSEKPSKFKWIIDPLDGTHSYMAGMPNFGVSVCFEKNGEMVAGVIFLPYINEMLTAERGKGAFLNGKRIKVSKKSDLDGSNGSFEMDSCYYSMQQYSRIYGKVFGKTLNVRSFGGVVDFSMVASGRMDFSISANTHAWDCAAATVIIEESGGKLTDFKGKPGPYISTVIASNGLLHRKILGALNR